ncbi:F0F1 ATP synthase subunit delta [Paracoccus aestuariivivens]|uniref:ATP synthase subunit delta n=1 Tax=Paracoccus aestuariivivens TaxID=1820333 RepID=A0A6L6J984_9RHOB|nr:F0F1 ATP synthase subunit delta [Paracoccus aestuariivivens]MTH78560.1 F0F1 ATP synthase subunit delta [Paracoccus aestuariivivens]
MTVANSASISADIAGRYAQALFDLVKDSGLDALSTQIDDLAAAFGESADLRDLTVSPLYGRNAQEAAISALASRMGFSVELTNTLRLLAQNRRLFTLPQFIAKLRGLIADARGEMTADVVSAQALTEDQKTRLADTLASKSGKKIKLNARVDETLIGGMIVKLGSQMIDSSIRSKLASLQNAMKEVG